MIQALLPLLIISYAVINSAEIISKFYQENGILIEEDGLSIIHEGHLYIPMIYRIPVDNVTLSPIDGCPFESGFLKDIMNLMMSGFHRMIPVQKHSPVIPGNRQKRFLGVAASIFGLGLSAWNKVEITSLKQSVKDMRTSLTEHSEKIDKVEKDIELINLKSQKIILTQNNILKSLGKMKRSMDCSKTEQHLLWSTLTSFALHIPSLYIRACDAAVAGKLTPDLLPIEHLRHLITTLEDFKDSPYEIWPNLIYEVGLFIPDTISKDPLMITGIIILPRLYNENIGKLYRLYSVNFVQNSTDVRLQVPYQIAKNQDKIWIPRMALCQGYPGLFICPQTIEDSSNDLCAEDIFLRNTTINCKKVVRKPGSNPIVISTKTGVLIGQQVNTTIIKVQTGKRLISKTLPFQKGPIFVINSDGDHVLINGKVYSLTSKTEEFTLKPLDLIPCQLESIALDNSLLDDDWNDIQSLQTKKDHQKSNNLRYSDIIIICIAIGMIICILGYTGVKLRQRSHRNISQVVGESHDLLDLSQALH